MLLLDVQQRMETPAVESSAVHPAWPRLLEWGTVEQGMRWSPDSESFESIWATPYRYAQMAHCQDLGPYLAAPP